LRFAIAGKIAQLARKAFGRVRKKPAGGAGRLKTNFRLRRLGMFKRKFLQNRETAIVQNTKLPS